MIESHETPPGVHEPVALGALSRVFLKVSLCGFGGGLALARRTVVDERQWLTAQEFSDIVSLCSISARAQHHRHCSLHRDEVAWRFRRYRRSRRFSPDTLGLDIAAGLLLLAHAQHPLLRKILGGLSATAADS